MHRMSKSSGEALRLRVPSSSAFHTEQLHWLLIFSIIILQRS
jgi:hypothetical protein